MKKLMMMVVAAMMATVNVNAQVENLRQEIGVTYGTGVSVFGDGLGEGLGRAIANGMFGMGKVGTETYDEKDFGTLSLEYFYHLNNPRLAVGDAGNRRAVPRQRAHTPEDVREPPVLRR